MTGCRYVTNKALKTKYKEYCDAQLLPMQMFKHQGTVYCKNHIINVRVDVSGKVPITKVVDLYEAIKQSKRH